MTPRMTAVTLIGDRCDVCNNLDIRVLRIIWRLGDRPRRISEGVWYEFVRDHVADFRLVCANCFWI